MGLFDDFRIAQAIDAEGDHESAYGHYLELAQRGHHGAQECLATMYRQGIGVARDLAEAFRWYSCAAENGDACAQTNLAEMYDAGEGIQRDPATALKWYQLAAGAGVDVAQVRLALKYLNGDGTDRNVRRGMESMFRYAQGGNSEAQFLLADLYKEGRLSGSPNLKKAANWYVNAALRGHRLASYEVGLMLVAGDVLVANLENAMFYLTIAAFGRIDGAERAAETVAAGLNQEQLNSAIERVRNFRPIVPGQPAATLGLT